MLLHNGWYTENDLASVPAALQHGAFIGAAGAGRIASATRADYAAAAAAAALTQPIAGSRVFELAGDTSYTLAELMVELNRQTGKAVRYQDLPQADFVAALIDAGLPPPFAELGDSDAGAAKGGLFDDGCQLSTLIGRRTTPLAVALKAALVQA